MQGFSFRQWCRTGGLFFAFYLGWCVLAQANVATAISHNEQSLQIQLGKDKVELQALTDGAVAVWYQPQNVRQLPSFALDPELDVRVKNKLEEASDGWLWHLSDLTVHIQRQPFKLSYWRKGQLLLSEESGLINQETIKGFRFALSDDEQIMGAGQRVLGMDRRGHRLPLYNRAHYGYTTESTQMYYSLSAVMSSKKYALIFDNSANGFVDIGHTESDVLQFEAVAGRTAYIVAAAADYAGLISEVTQITGRQPLPPRWALGNFASRFGYRNAQETLDTINLFRSQDIPVDAVVLDLYWFGPDIKGHMGNLTWDRNAWPEPEKMIATLREQGVKTIVITEPFILRSSSQWDSAVEHDALARNLAGAPRRFDFYFGNTGLVDVFDPAAQDWFWTYYERLARQGVAGWWGDLGEPEVHPADSIHRLNGEPATGDELHNAYGHQWAKMVYERQLALEPTQRPFVMMRSGFVGSQRYGMIPWTGDVSREWGGLQSQVELALQMGLFGLAYTHSDLGGFAGGERFDAELYTRWMQFGVFTPVYRPHAQDHIAPEPVFHPEPVKSHVREFVKLRYRLMPYIYSLAYENSLTGLPFMRPVMLHHAEAALENTRQYLFGESMLIQPITHAGVELVDVELPKGHWYHFWHGTALAGGKTHSIATPLDQIPVFVKAGAFIPMVAPVDSLDNYSTETMDVHFYVDPAQQASEYMLYDDDGTDPSNVTRMNYQSIHMQATYSPQLKLTLNVTGEYAGQPEKRAIKVIVHGLQQSPQRVSINEKAYSITHGEEVQWHSETAELHVQLSLRDQVSITLD
ncbi:TIM-barrel domain-containing protein [Alteromonas flava]|uniref:glycoside hydrolase family 31 protein n=1 Tax=Alteromonas flava TaxID=2048003 RepID=UPI000C28BE8A|nr:TIM-barrel domain-containing protein [Alteromonas flava]